VGGEIQAQLWPRDAADAAAIRDTVRESDWSTLTDPTWDALTDSADPIASHRSRRLTHSLDPVG